MGIIALEEIQPGMILASDLRTSLGRLLLPKNSAVGAEHLRMARIWGIAEADIEGVFADQPCENALDLVDSKLREPFEEIVAWRFAHCDMTALPVRRLMNLFVHRANAQAKSMGQGTLIIGKLRDQYIGHAVPLAQGEEEFSPASMPALTCEDMLRCDPTLACLPEIFHEIVEVAKSPKASAAHIAFVIGKDPSLSSRLLRLVNSAFYGFENRVDTLNRAVAIVGTVQISNLALGVTVTSVFRGIPPAFVDMQAFWEHSIAVGVISRLLGVHLQIPIRERLFVAGLLHDLGHLIIYKNYVEQAQALRRLAMSSAHPLTTLEREAWGFTHADLGSLLLQKWNIPQPIQDAAALHHSPLQSSAAEEAKLVHLADVIAYSLGFGHTGLRRVPPLCLQTWDYIGLPASALSLVAAQAENQLRDLMRVFLAD